MSSNRVRCQCVGECSGDPNSPECRHITVMVDAIPNSAACGADPHATPDREAEAREAAIKPLVDAGMTREQAIELIRAAIRRATR